MFPGMRERYVGHEEIAEFWHAATEPWESLQIETGRTMARGEDVVAQIWLTGRGRHSRVEVRGVEAGHLVRFRELKIVEFLAFATWDLAVEHLERSAGSDGRSLLRRRNRNAPLTHLLRRGPVALGVAGDGREEGVLLERVEPHVGLRRDGRRPRHVSKQRDLPEPLAATACLHEGTVDRDIAQAKDGHFKVVEELGVIDPEAMQAI